MGVPSLGFMGARHAEPPALSWQYPAAAAAPPPRAMVRRAPVRDQSQRNSCTGFAFYVVVSALSAVGFIPSPLALYYIFRRRSGFAPHQDQGAYMEPSVQALAAEGAGSEVLWPYLIDRYAVEPPRAYREQAADHRVLAWYRALSVAGLKSALAAGLPAAMAFEVPPGFGDVGLDGVWRDGGGSAIGAHAVACVGYDDAALGSGAFLMQNSWGTEWGVQHPDDAPGSPEGFFWVPYSEFPGRRWFDSIVVTMIDVEAGA